MYTVQCCTTIITHYYAIQQLSNILITQYLQRFEINFANQSNSIATIPFACRFSTGIGITSESIKSAVFRRQSIIGFSTMSSNNLRINLKILLRGPAADWPMDPSESTFKRQPASMRVRTIRVLVSYIATQKSPTIQTFNLVVWLVGFQLPAFREQ